MALQRLSGLLRGDQRDPRDELVDLFAPDGTCHPALTRAESWAREAVVTCGISVSDTARVARCLRRHRPELGVRTARYLAERLRLTT